jgi:DNA-binding NarL/FixJ family response regulator
LTPRQREVLQLIAEGFSTKEIARRLRVSTKTVESHRCDLMQRLDIHGIAALVRYAIRVGIVAPGS